jgi:PKHD-type hydroxylase
MDIKSRLTIPDPGTLTSVPVISDSPSVLTKQECDDLIAMMQEHERLELGKVGNGTKYNYNVDIRHRVVRSADILEQDAPWLYEKVTTLIHQFNKEFRFDLYGLLDDIIFMRYDEPSEDLPAGHFNWHPDAGAGYTAMRKFSIVIGLSDEADYEGGEFEYFYGGIESFGKIPQGMAVAFPSYINHRVLPITKGRRCSLVIFVIGPRFR